MSIRSLVDYMGETNIALGMDKDRLDKIALQVIERADKDEQTMKDWKDCVDQGIKLCKPEFQGKDDPWPGSANFKSTILTEAANQFGNRASIEIMRDPRLVKTGIVGAETIRNVIDRKASEIAQLKKELEPLMDQIKQLQEAQDPEAEKMLSAAQQIQEEIANRERNIKQKKIQLRQKDERAARVSEYMNWQINNKMKEWREDHIKMLYALPNIGTVFKKSFYDESLGRCVSDLVCYPDFIVNQKTRNLEYGVFTHIIPFSKSEYEIRVRNKIWRELETNPYHEKDLGQKGTNEEADVENTKYNPDHYYEQYTWLDLDDDGMDEPYIVTVHVNTVQVVRIVARYDYNGVIVKYVGKPGDVIQNIAPMPLLDAQKLRAQMIQKDAEEFNLEPQIPDANDLTGFKIVRIEPREVITKYGLIPAPDCSFLDVGYYWLIGSIALGVNKSTNDLLNAGTLANMQGGIVAKGFRKKPGSFSLKLGEFTQTEVPPDKLATSILPLPYKEPSATLFALNEKMENTARAFAANIDADGQIQGNTAPTTALAIIQEQMIQHTAHIMMIANSMSKEFSIIFSLNKDYLNPEEYKEAVGDDEAVFSDDFNTDGLSITCSANPEMSSRMQRMVLAEAEMAQVPMVMQAGGNPIPIIKNYYKRIGSDNLDEIFPNESEMSPEEKAQLEAMREQQALANQMAESQLKINQLQTELLMREQDRKDQEFGVSSRKTLAEASLTQEKVGEVKASTVLKIEQAESEQVNNKVSVYNALKTNEE